MPVNSVVIVGNLTRAPELKALPSGTQVAELGVAVNERVKNGEQWEDRASFFDVSVFGGQAESCAKFLDKGRQVAVHGRLRQERWQDQQGNNRSRVRIIANEVQFIGGKPDGQPQGHDNGQGAWGNQQQSGGFGQAPAQQYPVTQSDFGQPSQGAPPQQQSMGGGFGAPPPAQTGPGNSEPDIPF